MKSILKKTTSINSAASLNYIFFKLLLHIFRTSRAILFFCLQVFQEVGVPLGVLNLIHGLGSKAREAVVQPPDVKVISFTGSTLIGCHIAKVAVPLMKKLSLELGGKNAALVFADGKLVQV